MTHMTKDLGTKDKWKMKFNKSEFEEGKTITFLLIDLGAIVSHGQMMGLFYHGACKVNGKVIAKDEKIFLSDFENDQLKINIGKRLSFDLVINGEFVYLKSKE